MQVHLETQYAGYECVQIENETLSLWVTCSVGPRIIGLAFQGGENVFAELPDLTLECPGVSVYHLRGGHRLWHASEEP